MNAGDFPFMVPDFPDYNNTSAFRGLGRGVFGYATFYNLSAITDGTSNTAVFCERCSSPETGCGGSWSAEGLPVGVIHTSTGITRIKEACILYYAPGWAAGPNGWELVDRGGVCPHGEPMASTPIPLPPTRIVFMGTLAGDSSTDMRVGTALRRFFRPMLRVALITLKGNRQVLHLVAPQVA